MRRTLICGIACALAMACAVAFSQSPGQQPAPAAAPTGAVPNAAPPGQGRGAQAAPNPNAAPASAVVTGSGTFSPIVADLGQAIKFYNDLVGNAPAANVPAFSTQDSLVNFLGTPTGSVGVGQVRIPGSPMGVEIVDFKGVDRKPAPVRLQDPGAVRLILTVRDLDTLLAHLKSQGVPVVTAGGAPVTLTGKNPGRAVMIKDPDGHFIELIQPNTLPDTTAPATSNVIGANFGLTINDTDQTMKVYRDLLGFQPEVDAAFSTDKPLMDLMNTAGAQVRRSIAKIPGSIVQVEFLEFKGIDRKPIGARIQDPGATRLQLRVKESDAATKALVAAGSTVITTGGDGGPIIMNGLRVALVREPNNLFLVIFTNIPRAPGPPAPGAEQRGVPPSPAARQ